MECACDRLHKGFTLIELSIVLIIIGLITGGILVGRDLIRAAELRAVISQLDSFKAAVYTFKGKYNCLPGDCPTATDYWPEDVSCPLTPSNQTPKIATCDGNGDGNVHSSAAFASYPQEMFRFWQHLANANLIAGVYSGSTMWGSPDTEDCAFGINVPAGKMAGTAWVIRYWDADDLPSYGSPLNPAYVDKNFFSFVGGDNNDFVPFGNGGDRALNPHDAWNIDSKLDDGIPYSGNVFPMDIIAGNSQNCLTAYAVPTQYNMASVSNVAVACNLNMAGGF
jgi:prepilin-type N-terminal cleavage/methylation domain-containing protein